MASILKCVHALGEARALELQLNVQEHGRLFPQTEPGSRALRTVYRGVRSNPVPPTETVRQGLALAVEGLGLGAFGDPAGLREDSRALRTHWLRWKCSTYGRRFLKRRLDAMSVADSEEDLLMDMLERLEARVAAREAGLPDPAGADTERAAAEEHAGGAPEELQGAAAEGAAAEGAAAEGTAAEAAEPEGAEEHPAATDEATRGEDAADEQHANPTEDKAAPGEDAAEHAHADDERPAAVDQPAEGTDGGAADEHAEPTAKKGNATSYQLFLAETQQAEPCVSLPFRLRWHAARALWQEKAGNPRKALKAINEVMVKAQMEPMQGMPQGSSPQTILIDIASKLREKPLRLGCPRCRFNPLGCSKCAGKAAHAERKARPGSSAAAAGEAAPEEDAEA